MNAFEALCKLASDEEWCWNLYCTTCGHMHFKYAFLELSKGKSPQDSDWPLRNSETSYLHRLLGPIPRRFHPIQKDKILRICFDANILSIAEVCRFPDWLGYLGLVLEHMKSRTIPYKAVCLRWTIQLRELVPEYTTAHKRLTEIMKSHELILSIQDLETCESDIMRK